MPKPSRIGYTPTHPQFIVDFGDGEFSSCLRSTRTFDVGEYIIPLEASRLTKGPKAYTSLQCGPGQDDHIELNSDLVYTNHSCDPNLAFDFSSPDPKDWHLRALKHIRPDESVTFFYPSTEWDMDQPFTCDCQAKNCLGRIKGAKYLTMHQLVQQRWMNPYIFHLAAQRDRQSHL